MFSEMLLQMECLDLPSYHDILWSNETEVAVEDGAVLIPRVVLDDGLTNCFNATRRMITQSVSPLSDPIKMSARDECITMEKVMSDVEEDSRMGLGAIQVLSSSLFRFACLGGGQPFCICIGYATDMEQKVLAISEINGSAIMVKPDCTINCKGDANTDEMLSAILTVAMCESLLSGSTGTVWIHNADDCTAEIVCSIAGPKNIPVFFTTSDRASMLNSVGRATYVHARATEREVRSLVPHNTRLYVNMGPDADSIADTASWCAKHGVDNQQEIYHNSTKQTISLSYSRSSLVMMLKDYCSRPDFLRDLGRRVQRTAFKADFLPTKSQRVNATSIVSWTGVQSIPVQVIPATSIQLLADQKTYFLIGLTGDLGLSLCEWMIDHGAKYLAIASRSPIVPPEMLTHLQRKGVTIRVFSLDVADMKSLNNVHHEIVSSMPPIAGVANAALVVRDHLFDGMHFEDLEAVFRPKVVGTQNLDGLFFTTPLDFFILFSSVASIVGKPAQSSYNAANLFMSTLAIRRRKRGLASSIMHFGMLLGLGFIHGQAGSTVEARFRQDDLPAISEPEFHAIFAQAILSGHPSSGMNPEIIAGLGTEIDTPWRQMPRFGHCRIRGEDLRAEGQHRGPEKTFQSIQPHLKKACDSKQALSILKEAIATRVSLALGSPSAAVDEHVALISLGLDSLVAVEIRSWVLKILGIDVPVLNLLNGSSLHDICHSLLSKLPHLLRPWDKDKDNDTSDGFSAREAPIEPSLNGIDRTQPLDSGDPNGKLVVDATRGSDVPSHSQPQNTMPNNSQEQLRPQTEHERVGDMSHAQAQLYFLHEYLQNNAYNIAYSGRFHGRLDMIRLQEALGVVGKRHEALRSAYFIDMSTARPVQAVFSEPRIVLVHRNVRDDSQVQTEIAGVKQSRF